MYAFQRIVSTYHKTKIIKEIKYSVMVWEPCLTQLLAQTIAPIFFWWILGYENVIGLGTQSSHNG